MSFEIPEAALQRTLVEAARFYGYRVHHTRPARTVHGWRTAIMGDKGFPDLVLALDGLVHAWELKSGTGRLDGEQRAWASALGEGEPTRLEWRLVRPSGLDEALAILEDDAAGRRR